MKLSYSVPFPGRVPSSGNRHFIILAQAGREFQSFSSKLMSTSRLFPSRQERPRPAQAGRMEKRRCPSERTASLSPVRPGRQGHLLIEVQGAAAPFQLGEQIRLAHPGQLLQGPAVQPEGKQPPDYVVPGQKYWFFRYLSDDISVDVVDIRSFPWLERFEKEKIRFYIWQTLKVLPKLNQYDLVLSHGMQSGIVLCLWRRLFGHGKYKHIVFDIGGFNSAKEEGKALKLMQFASKSLDGVIYHTKSQITYYEKCHPWLLSKSRYIAFGTDAEYFQPTGTPIEKENSYILCVGYNKRDWDTLLQAYEKLRNLQKGRNQDGLADFPKLKLIGKEKLDREYDGVETVGFIPVTQLMKEIEKATFCVLPLQSFNYSFGQMTLLQQMLLKKAVIAANVPSLRDYVTDGQDCLLYEPENAEELAEQMERLIKDSEFSRQLGENAMQSVREKWNEKRMAQDIWEFCREIVR